MKGEDMTNPGKLIVVEGGDGTGKQTQAELLVEKINKSAKIQGQARYVSFPNYGSYWGDKVQDYKNEEFCSLEESGPFSALLYSMDRFDQRDYLIEILERGDWIVCDRYVESNWVYQGIKIADIEQRDRFQEFLREFEYKRGELPVPDIFFYLDIDISLQKKRLLEKAESGDTDAHERNLEFMKESIEEYRRLARKHSWEVINCCNEAGEQFPRQEIAEEIFNKVCETTL